MTTNPESHSLVDNRWAGRAWLALMVLTLLTFVRLGGVELSWDDEALVKDNQVTSSLANIPDFFTRDLWSTTRLSWLKSGYYRPLMLVSLAVDRALYGLSSMGAHVHSLLWHMGAVSLLFVFLLRLVPAWNAIAGAMLFAIHPVQVEVLALVAARNDAMAAVFVLGALLCLLPMHQRSPLPIGAAALLALCGLLSKESAVLAPLMLLSLDVARAPSLAAAFARQGPVRAGWIRYAALLGSIGIYIPLRRLAEADSAITPTWDAFALLGTHAGNVMGLYSSLLVWPWPLTPARHLHYLPPLNDVLLGALIAGALVLWALLRGTQTRLAWTGVIWAIVTWLPSLAATLDKGLLGERYLYFSIAGLGLTLAAALPQQWPRSALVAFALPAFLAIQARLPHWKDSRTVWEHAHAVAPSAFTAGGLAWYVHRDKDYDRAIPLFRMALEGEPPYRDVCDMIVMASLQANRSPEAISVGKWAIEERGCNATGLIGHHYAIALAGAGRWDEAARVAAQLTALTEGPGFVVALADRARRGDIETVRRAAAQRPTDTDLLRRVAKLLRMGGQAAASEAVLQAAPPPLSTP